MPRLRCALVPALGLLATYPLSSCTSGSHAPNAVIERVALGPPQATQPSAAAPSRKAPAAVATAIRLEPALLGPSPGAEPATARVWPAPSRELLEKRLAAQLHVLGRAAVREPKTARGSRATLPSKPAPAEPTPAAESPAADRLAAEVDRGSATLMCEEHSTRSASASSDSANSDATGIGGRRFRAFDRSGQRTPAELRSASCYRAVRCAKPPSTRLRSRTSPRYWPFIARSSRLSRGEDPDGKVRILAYGASHTQADYLPGLPARVSAVPFRQRRARLRVTRSRQQLAPHARRANVAAWPDAAARSLQTSADE